MVLKSTRAMAAMAIERMVGRLRATCQEELPTVRSIFVTGSYLRGDWLEFSSDLDLGLLFFEQSDPLRREADLGVLRSMVNDCEFPSHTPGGIDWNTQLALPTELDQRVIGPYFPYSIFLFDFVTHIRVLWGEDFQGTLPVADNPRELSLPAISFLVSRARTVTDTPEGRRRLAYAAFKTVQILQIHFGEQTLDKVRLLELYRRYVPEFDQKATGEFIIRDYYGSIYPDRAPIYRETLLYRSFMEGALALLTSLQ